MTKRIDIAIGEILSKNPQMIRFYATRMMLELGLGRRLTGKEPQKVYNKSSVKLWKEVS